MTRIIDFHVHLCRDRKQERTVFPHDNWPLDWYWANPEGIRPYMDARGISHVVTHNIMDVRRIVLGHFLRGGGSVEDAESIEAAFQRAIPEMRERVSRFNDWGCELHSKDDGIHVFVMADPGLFGPDLAGAVEHWARQGASGVKIHPSISRILPTDERLMPLYEYCQSTGLPILTDTNSRDVPKGLGFGYPQHWRPVLRSFPNLRLVMAHLGEGMWDERLALADEFRDNLWFDFSGGLVDPEVRVGGHAHLSLEQAPRVFKRIGIERIMFGSDEPAFGVDVRDLALQVFRMELTDSEREALLWRNAAAFLVLEER
jgi:predicted TIM-barrel fold metal-dependent hydrolase